NHVPTCVRGSAGGCRGERATAWCVRLGPGDHAHAPRRRRSGFACAYRSRASSLMATFARDGATFQTELVRDGRALREQRKTDVRKQTYASEIEARAAFDRRVIELVDDGWGLVTPDADFGTPVARDPAQERAILAATTDRAELLAVYNDW